MSDPLVRFINVRKTYDGHTLVVRNLNLDVREGEFLTLLGPSGSGKTTTLMMLAGFETPSSGEILLQGRDIAHLAPHKRGIGVVFQNYALFPHMTVAENVAFPLTVRGVRRAERAARVKRALEMVRLPDLGDRRPSQLSGGQQQRVALARAMVFEPPLVLMDEPLGALDKQLREEMQMEIRHLHEQLGITMVYVTHDQSEALTMSNRIAVFADGMIRQLDTPEALYERPADAFVANFIGENNRLSGTIGETDDDGIADVALDCGITVQAQAVDTGGAGSRCMVSIRPERIALAGGVRAADLGDDAVPAKLLEAIYLGDHIRLRLGLGQNESGEIMVKRPAVAGMAGLTIGGNAALAWRPEHAYAFRQEVS